MTGMFEVGNIYKTGSIKALCIDRNAPFIKFYVYSPAKEFGLNEVVTCRRTVIEDVLEAVNIHGYKIIAYDKAPEWAISQEFEEKGELETRRDFHRHSYQKIIVEENKLILSGDCNMEKLAKYKARESKHQIAYVALKDIIMKKRITEC